MLLSIYAKIVRPNCLNLILFFFWHLQSLFRKGVDAQLPDSNTWYLLSVRIYS